MESGGGGARGRKLGESTVGELYEGVQERWEIPRILFLYPLYKSPILYKTILQPLIPNLSLTHRCSSRSAKRKVQTHQRNLINQA